MNSPARTTLKAVTVAALAGSLLLPGASASADDSALYTNRGPAGQECLLVLRETPDKAKLVWWKAGRTSINSVRLHHGSRHRWVGNHKFAEVTVTANALASTVGRHGRVKRYSRVTGSQATSGPCALPSSPIPEGTTFIRQTTQGIFRFGLVFTRTGTTIRYVWFPGAGHTSCFKGVYRDGALRGTSITEYPSETIVSHTTRGIFKVGNAWQLDGGRSFETMRPWDFDNMSFLWRKAVSEGLVYCSQLIP